jgi:bacterial/archaeal transporter family-2 protein
MIFLLIALTVIIGTLLPVQASLNAELTKILKHPYLGAFISFFTGTLTLGVLIFFHQVPLGDLRRLGEVPIHYYLGGLMGALFVGSSIFLIPRLGPTMMMAAFVTGQLLSSVVIDHFGWFHVPVYPVTPQRIVGIILLFAGLLLVIKKTA